MGILGGDLEQSHCSALFVPPGRSPGCRRSETYMRPDTRILCPAPGLRNEPLFFFSVAFHTMSHPVSKKNSGSKLLQTST